MRTSSIVLRISAIPLFAFGYVGLTIGLITFKSATGVELIRSLLIISGFAVIALQSVGEVVLYVKEKRKTSK